jgi:3-oxoadipate enol-lactonase
MPFLKLNDAQLYYELHGDAQKSVILFLHGLGSSVVDWEFQQPYFQAQYRVLLVDMRGHGRSDKPKGPYTIAQFARDVVGLLDHLAIDQVHVVGLSMGGMIAFQLAADFPQRVRSLTITNSGPSFVVRTLKERFSIWIRFFIVRALGMRKLGEMLAPRLFPDTDQEALRQTFATRWAENKPRAYMDALRALVSWGGGVEDRLSGINIPTLIVAADADYTPLATKEAYLRKMPNASLKIIPNSHHAVPMERPQAFNEIVGAFVGAQA